MSGLLVQVQELIRTLASLSEEQRARFLHVLPKLDETQLSTLHTVLLKVQAEDVARMKKQIEQCSKAGAAFQEWKADKARAHLHATERNSAQADVSSAETLLSKL